MGRIIGLVAVVVVVGAAGWFFKDRFMGDADGTGPEVIGGEPVTSAADPSGATENALQDADEAPVVEGHGDYVETQQAYLAENALREGVTVTPSGLQFRVLSESGQNDKPSATDIVQVHYRGRLIDGIEFESSYNYGEPAEFPLNQVITGWTEGVQLMNVGDIYEFTIPAELAYGSRGAGDEILPGAVLIFEIELLDIIRP